MHVQSLRGGASLTFAMIREKYGIWRVQVLTKQIIRSCDNCKRFQLAVL